MSIHFRSYLDQPRFGSDYKRLREFYLELSDINFSFGRWDWMISHSMLDESGLSKIGIWEENGEIVGVVTFDTQLDGNCFLLVKDGYGCLRSEMIRYAEESLGGQEPIQLSIPDGDTSFQEQALEMGYLPTQEKDGYAVFTINSDKLSYSLPDGFSITSMKETFDLYQYGSVLWKGFNHELDGEGSFAPTSQELDKLRMEFERPNVIPELKIAVLNPDGHFVSYCGMWQDPSSTSAIVEPVATDPAYRRMGLGRAAVYEAMRQCGLRGAKRAYVGSTQQFYYRIGFCPCMTATLWRLGNSLPPVR